MFCVRHTSTHALRANTQTELQIIDDRNAAAMLSVRTAPVSLARLVWRARARVRETFAEECGGCCALIGSLC